MDEYEMDELTVVGCPECGAPAEVIDRFVMESTDGPIEMVKLRCISRRWFTVLVEDLARSQPEPVSEEVSRARRT